MNPRLCRGYCAYLCSAAVLPVIWHRRTCRNRAADYRGGPGRGCSGVVVRCDRPQPGCGDERMVTSVTSSHALSAENRWPSVLLTRLDSITPPVGRRSRRRIGRRRCSHSGRIVWARHDRRVDRKMSSVFIAAMRLIWTMQTALDYDTHATYKPTRAIGSSDFEAHVPRSPIKSTRGLLS
jgi:hypothetical protein